MKAKRALESACPVFTSVSGGLQDYCAACGFHRLEHSESSEVAKLQNRIAQLEGEKRATAEALAHWRRGADRDYGEICRLRQELAEALFELANK